MRKNILYFGLGLFVFFSTAVARADALYVKTFGDSSKPVLIFVHGGPGFNSWDFEKTGPKNFNYAAYAIDLKKIIDNLNLKNPTLLGHSHGGPISINFDMQYPGIAKSIILVSGPINFY